MHFENLCSRRDLEILRDNLGSHGFHIVDPSSHVEDLGGIDELIFGYVPDNSTDPDRLEYLGLIFRGDKVFNDDIEYFKPKHVRRRM